MFKKGRKRAQTATEYALLIAVVLACFVGMQTYIKRGLQASLKEIADDFGDQEAQEFANRDAVLKAYSTDLNTKSESNVRTELLASGARKKTLPEDSNKSSTTGTTEYRNEQN